MTAANKPFPFQHQLEKVLLPLCNEVDPSFELLREPLRRLDSYSVDFRYPGEHADQTDASRALKAMKMVRAFIRSKLGMSAGKE